MKILEIVDLLGGSTSMRGEESSGKLHNDLLNASTIDEFESIISTYDRSKLEESPPNLLSWISVLNRLDAVLQECVVCLHSSHVLVLAVAVGEGGEKLNKSSAKSTAPHLHILPTPISNRLMNIILQNAGISNDDIVAKSISVISNPNRVFTLLQCTLHFIQCLLKYSTEKNAFNSIEYLVLVAHVIEGDMAERALECLFSLSLSYFQSRTLNEVNEVNVLTPIMEVFNNKHIKKFQSNEFNPLAGDSASSDSSSPLYSSRYDHSFGNGDKSGKENYCKNYSLGSICTNSDSLEILMSFICGAVGPQRKVFCDGSVETEFVDFFKGYLDLGFIDKKKILSLIYGDKFEIFYDRDEEYYSNRRGILTLGERQYLETLNISKITWDTDFSSSSSCSSSSSGCGASTSDLIHLNDVLSKIDNSYMYKFEVLWKLKCLKSQTSNAPEHVLGRHKIFNLICKASYSVICNEKSGRHDILTELFGSDTYNAYNSNRNTPFLQRCNSSEDLRLFNQFNQCIVFEEIMFGVENFSDEYTSTYLALVKAQGSASLKAVEATLARKYDDDLIECVRETRLVSSYVLSQVFEKIGSIENVEGSLEHSVIFSKGLFKFVLDYLWSKSSTSMISGGLANNNEDVFEDSQRLDFIRYKHSSKYGDLLYVLLVQELDLLLKVKQGDIVISSSSIPFNNVVEDSSRIYISESAFNHRMRLLESYLMITHSFFEFDNFSKSLLNDINFIHIAISIVTTGYRLSNQFLKSNFYLRTVECYLNTVVDRTFHDCSLCKKFISNSSNYKSNGINLNRDVGSGDASYHYIMLILERLAYECEQISAPAKIEGFKEGDHEEGPASGGLSRSFKNSENRSYFLLLLSLVTLVSTYVSCSSPIVNSSEILLNDRFLVIITEIIHVSSNYSNAMIYQLLLMFESIFDPIKYRRDIILAFMDSGVLSAFITLIENSINNYENDDFYARIMSVLTNITVLNVKFSNGISSSNSPRGFLKPQLIRTSSVKNILAKVFSLLHNDPFTSSDSLLLSDDTISIIGMKIRFMIYSNYKESEAAKSVGSRSASEPASPSSPKASELGVCDVVKECIVEEIRYLQGIFDKYNSSTHDYKSSDEKVTCQMKLHLMFHSFSTLLKYIVMEPKKVTDNGNGGYDYGEEQYSEEAYDEEEEEEEDGDDASGLYTHDSNDEDSSSSNRFDVPVPPSSNSAPLASKNKPASASNQDSIEDDDSGVWEDCDEDGDDDEGWEDENSEEEELGEKDKENVSGNNISPSMENAAASGTASVPATLAPPFLGQNRADAASEDLASESKSKKRVKFNKGFHSFLMRDFSDVFSSKLLKLTKCFIGTNDCHFQHSLLFDVSAHLNNMNFVHVRPDFDELPRDDAKKRPNIDVDRKKSIYRHVSDLMSDMDPIYEQIHFMWIKIIFSVCEFSDDAWDNLLEVLKDSISTIEALVKANAHLQQDFDLSGNKQNHDFKPANFGNDVRNYCIFLSNSSKLETYVADDSSSSSSSSSYKNFIFNDALYSQNSNSVASINRELMHFNFLFSAICTSIHFFGRSFKGKLLKFLHANSSTEDACLNDYSKDEFTSDRNKANLKSSGTSTWSARIQMSTKETKSEIRKSENFESIRSIYRLYFKNYLPILTSFWKSIKALKVTEASTSSSRTFLEGISNNSISKRTIGNPSSGVGRQFEYLLVHHNYGTRYAFAFDNYTGSKNASSNNNNNNSTASIHGNFNYNVNYVYDNISSTFDNGSSRSINNNRSENISTVCHRLEGTLSYIKCSDRFSIMNTSTGIFETVYEVDSSSSNSESKVYLSDKDASFVQLFDCIGISKSASDQTNQKVYWNLEVSTFETLGLLLTVSQTLFDDFEKNYSWAEDDFNNGQIGYTDSKHNSIVSYFLDENDFEDLFSSKSERNSTATSESDNEVSRYLKAIFDTKLSLFSPYFIRNCRSTAYTISNSRHKFGIFRKDSFLLNTADICRRFVETCDFESSLTSKAISVQIIEVFIDFAETLCFALESDFFALISDKSSPISFYNDRGKILVDIILQLLNNLIEFSINTFNFSTHFNCRVSIRLLKVCEILFTFLYHFIMISNGFFMNSRIISPSKEGIKTNSKTPILSAFTIASLGGTEEKLLETNDSRVENVVAAFRSSLTLYFKLLVHIISNIPEGTTDIVVINAQDRVATCPRTLQLLLADINSSNSNISSRHYFISDIFFHNVHSVFQYLNLNLDNELLYELYNCNPTDGKCVAANSNSDPGLKQIPSRYAFNSFLLFFLFSLTNTNNEAQGGSGLSAMNRQRNVAALIALAMSAIHDNKVPLSLDAFTNLDSNCNGLLLSSDKKDTPEQPNRSEAAEFKIDSSNFPNSSSFSPAAPLRTIFSNLTQSSEGKEEEGSGDKMTEFFSNFMSLSLSEVQTILDPNVFQSAIDSPEIQRMFSKNPEMREIFSNPSIVREAINLLRDPDVKSEIQGESQSVKSNFLQALGALDTSVSSPNNMNNISGGGSSSAVDDNISNNSINATSQDFKALSQRYRCVFNAGVNARNSINVQSSIQYVIQLGTEIFTTGIQTFGDHIRALMADGNWTSISMGSIIYFEPIDIDSSSSMHNFDEVYKNAYEQWSSHGIKHFSSLFSSNGSCSLFSTSLFNRIGPAEVFNISQVNINLAYAPEFTRQENELLFSLLMKLSNASGGNDSETSSAISFEHIGNTMDNISDRFKNSTERPEETAEFYSKMPVSISESVASLSYLLNLYHLYNKDKLITLETVPILNIIKCFDANLDSCWQDKKYHSFLNMMYNNPDHASQGSGNNLARHIPSPNFSANESLNVVENCLFTFRNANKLQVLICKILADPPHNHFSSWRASDGARLSSRQTTPLIIFDSSTASSVADTISANLGKCEEVGGNQNILFKSDLFMEQSDEDSVKSALLAIKALDIVHLIVLDNTKRGIYNDQSLVDLSIRSLKLLRSSIFSYSKLENIGENVNFNYVTEWFISKSWDRFQSVMNLGVIFNNEGNIDGADEKVENDEGNDGSMNVLGLLLSDTVSLFFKSLHVNLKKDQVSASSSMHDYFMASFKEAFADFSLVTIQSKLNFEKKLQIATDKLFSLFCVNGKLFFKVLSEFNDAVSADQSSEENKMLCMSIQMFSEFLSSDVSLSPSTIRTFSIKRSTDNFDSTSKIVKVLNLRKALMISHNEVRNGNVLLDLQNNEDRDDVVEKLPVFLIHDYFTTIVNNMHSNLSLIVDSARVGLISNHYKRFLSSVRFIANVIHYFHYEQRDSLLLVLKDYNLMSRECKQRNLRGFYEAQNIDADIIDNCFLDVIFRTVIMGDGDASDMAMSGSQSEKEKKKIFYSSSNSELFASVCYLFESLVSDSNNGYDNLTSTRNNTDFSKPPQSHSGFPANNLNPDISETKHSNPYNVSYSNNMQFREAIARYFVTKFDFVTQKISHIIESCWIKKWSSSNNAWFYFNIKTAEVNFDAPCKFGDGTGTFGLSSSSSSSSSAAASFPSGDNGDLIIDFDDAVNYFVKLIKLLDFKILLLSTSSDDFIVNSTGNESNYSYEKSYATFAASKMNTIYTFIRLKFQARLLKCMEICNKVLNFTGIYSNNKKDSCPDLFVTFALLSVAENIAKKYGFCIRKIYLENFAQYDNSLYLSTMNDEVKSGASEAKEEDDQELSFFNLGCCVARECHDDDEDRCAKLKYFLNSNFFKDALPSLNVDLDDKISPNSIHDVIGESKSLLDSRHVSYSSQKLDLDKSRRNFMNQVISDSVFCTVNNYIESNAKAKGQNNKQDKKTICSNNHILELSSYDHGDYLHGWHCNYCDSFGSGGRWFCKPCKFDCCNRCYFDKRDVEVNATTTAALNNSGKIMNSFIFEGNNINLSPEIHSDIERIEEEAAEASFCNTSVDSDANSFNENYDRQSAGNDFSSDEELEEDNSIVYSDIDNSDTNSQHKLPDPFRALKMDEYTFLREDPFKSPKKYEHYEVAVDNDLESGNAGSCSLEYSNHRCNINVKFLKRVFKKTVLMDSLVREIGYYNDYVNLNQDAAKVDTLAFLMGFQSHKSKNSNSSANSNLANRNLPVVANLTLDYYCYLPHICRQDSLERVNSPSFNSQVFGDSSLRKSNTLWYAPGNWAYNNVCKLGRILVSSMVRDSDLSAFTDSYLPYSKLASSFLKNILTSSKVYGPKWSLTSAGGLQTGQILSIERPEVKLELNNNPSTIELLNSQSDFEPDDEELLKAIAMSFNETTINESTDNKSTFNGKSTISPPVEKLDWGMKISKRSLRHPKNTLLLSDFETYRSEVLLQLVEVLISSFEFISHTLTSNFISKQSNILFNNIDMPINDNVDSHNWNGLSDFDISKKMEPWRSCNELCIVDLFDVVPKCAFDLFNDSAWGMEKGSEAFSVNTSKGGAIRSDLAEVSSRIRITKDRSVFLESFRNLIVDGLFMLLNSELPLPILCTCNEGGGGNEVFQKVEVEDEDEVEDDEATLMKKAVAMSLELDTVPDSQSKSSSAVHFIIDYVLPYFIAGNFLGSVSKFNNNTELEEELNDNILSSIRKCGIDLSSYRRRLDAISAKVLQISNSSLDSSSSSISSSSLEKAAGDHNDFQYNLSHFHKAFYQSEFSFPHRILAYDSFPHADIGSKMLPIKFKSMIDAVDHIFRIWDAKGSEKIIKSLESKHPYLDCLFLPDKLDKNDTRNDQDFEPKSTLQAVLEDRNTASANTHFGNFFVGYLRNFHGKESFNNPESSAHIGFRSGAFYKVLKVVTLMSDLSGLSTSLKLQNKTSGSPSNVSAGTAQDCFISSVLLKLKLLILTVNYFDFSQDESMGFYEKDVSFDEKMQEDTLPYVIYYITKASNVSLKNQQSKGGNGVGSNEHLLLILLLTVIFVDYELGLFEKLKNIIDQIIKFETKRQRFTNVKPVFDGDDDRGSPMILSIHKFFSNLLYILLNFVVDELKHIDQGNKEDISTSSTGRSGGRSSASSAKTESGDVDENTSEFDFANRAANFFILNLNKSCSRNSLLRLRKVFDNIVNLTRLHASLFGELYKFDVTREHEMNEERLNFNLSTIFRCVFNHEGNSLLVSFIKRFGNDQNMTNCYRYFDLKQISKSTEIDESSLGSKFLENRSSKLSSYDYFTFYKFVESAFEYISFSVGMSIFGVEETLNPVSNLDRGGTGQHIDPKISVNGSSFYSKVNEIFSVFLNQIASEDERKVMGDSVDDDDDDDDDDDSASVQSYSIFEDTFGAKVTSPSSSTQYIELECPDSIDIETWTQLPRDIQLEMVGVDTEQTSAKKTSSSSKKKSGDSAKPSSAIVCEPKKANMDGHATVMREIHHKFSSVHDELNGLCEKCNSSGDRFEFENLLMLFNFMSAQIIDSRSLFATLTRRMIIYEKFLFFHHSYWFIIANVTSVLNSDIGLKALIRDTTAVKISDDIVTENFEFKQQLFYRFLKILLFLATKTNSRLEKQFQEREKESVKIEPVIQLGGEFTAHMQRMESFAWDGISERSNQYFDSDPEIDLKIERKNPIISSYYKLKDLEPLAFLLKRIRVEFSDEMGVDQGGLFKEFFMIFSREILNSKYGLFMQNESSKEEGGPSVYLPSPGSSLQEDYLSYFTILGKFMGIAMREKLLLNSRFPCIFYKLVLQYYRGSKSNIPLEELKEWDESLYAMFNQIADPAMSLSDLGLDDSLTFSVDRKGAAGVVVTEDLIEDGRNVMVTDANKLDYIQRVLNHKLRNSFQGQIDAISDGIYSIVPFEILSIFNANELQFLTSINENEDIDIDDLQKHTLFGNGYHSHDKTILRFFKVLRTFDNMQKRNFLQFATGSRHVPLGGFACLKSSNSDHHYTWFKIEKCSGISNQQSNSNAAPDHSPSPSPSFGSPIVGGGVNAKSSNLAVYCKHFPEKWTHRDVYERFTELGLQHHEIKDVWISHDYCVVTFSDREAAERAVNLNNLNPISYITAKTGTPEEHPVNFFAEDSTSFEMSPPAINTSTSAAFANHISSNSAFTSMHQMNNPTLLPTSHTCYNQLDLPPYESDDVMRDKLLKAIEMGCEGFGFA